VCPSTEFIRALADHPIHPRVLLSFDSEYTFKVPWRVDDQELNDALREFRYPLQLKIPYRLLDFVGEGEIFTTNPAFTSLTIVPSIPRHGPKVLSGEMLDGIALNKSVATLTIDVQHWTSFDWDEEIPEFISSLFSRLICASSSSIRSLELVSGNFYICLCEPAESHRPNGFDLLIERLTSLAVDMSRHRLASFRMTCAHNNFAPPRTSTQLWDSHFSPALLLNCLRRQRGGYPSITYSGLAVRNINRGVLYRSASNLIPWDLSPSSSSVIFAILRSSIPRSESGKDCKCKPGGTTKLLDKNVNSQSHNF
jgi:hypothetical protein